MNDPKWESHKAALREKYESVYQWVNQQPGVSADFVQVPIESLQELLHGTQPESGDALERETEWGKLAFAACVYLDKAVPVYGRTNSERIRFAADEIVRLRSEVQRMHSALKIIHDKANAVIVSLSVLRVSDNANYTVLRDIASDALKGST